MSPPNKHASVIYAEELSYLKEGHALWIPEGPNNSADVQLGDVGYINANGAFIFLFSIDKRSEGVASRQMARYPGLEGYGYFDFEAPLTSDMVKTYDNYLQPDVYKSRTVRKKTIRGMAGGGMPAVAEGHINVEYEVQEDRGATCWLPEVGVLMEIELNKRFEQYVRENIYGWYEAVSAYHNINLEDLVVIKGTIKSSQYKVMAIYSGQESGAVDVGAGALDVVDVGVNMGLVFHRKTRYTERSLLFSGNPDAAMAPTAQSRKVPIFLKYYKMKQRWGILKRLEANAGPHSLPPGDNPSEESPVSILVDESDSEDSDTTTRTAIQPVDLLLDYILEACPSAEFALACDEDINSVFLGEGLPDDIIGSLRERRPKLALDSRKVGSLDLEEVVRRECASRISGRPVSGDSLQTTVKIRDSSGNDRSIDLPYLQLSKKAQQHGSLTTITVSPDGKLVAAGFNDAAIVFWQLPAGVDYEPFRVHEDAIQALKFSPDGSAIASGSADHKIIVQTIVADRDGEGLSIGHITLLGEHDGAVTVIEYSRDGSRLVSGSLDGALKIWDVSQSYAALLSINNTTCPHWISFTADCGGLAVTRDDTLVVLDSNDGKTLATLRGHEGVIYMAAISHDGTRIATASEDCTARVWILQTGVELLTLREHSEPVWCIAFSPDDDEVVTGSDDATIVIANSWDGQRRAVITDNGGPVDSVSYSKSGHLICASTMEGSVTLADARSGEFVASYGGQEDGKTRNVRFSADSVITSSEDGTAYVFDVSDVLRLR